MHMDEPVFISSLSLLGFCFELIELSLEINSSSVEEARIILCLAFICKPDLMAMQTRVSAYFFVFFFISIFTFLVSVSLSAYNWKSFVL